MARLSRDRLLADRLIIGRPSWEAAISAGVSHWDRSTYCGPDFVKTTNASLARVTFAAGGAMCGDKTNYIAVVCRNLTNDPNNQVRTVGFHTSTRSFGVGVAGRFDVESITTNEMGHVMYLDHNTGWSDGTVQANSCVWGSTQCTVKNNLHFSDFSEYGVTCSNCGNRRVVLTGDLAVVKHIYGLHPCPCPEAASTVLPPLSATEMHIADEMLNPRTTMDFWIDQH